MVWQPEIEELNARAEMANRMGGKEGIAVQHKRGKLTIRERLDTLCDPGTFQEIGGLAGHATYEDGELVNVRPSSLHCPMIVLEGRTFTSSPSSYVACPASPPIS